MFDVRDPTIDALRAAPVKLRYRPAGKVQKVLVDAFTASAILAVHKAANPQNQAKMERMLADPAKVHRLIGFCFSQVR